MTKCWVSAADYERYWKRRVKRVARDAERVVNPLKEAREQAVVSLSVLHRAVKRRRLPENN